MPKFTVFFAHFTLFSLLLSRIPRGYPFPRLRLFFSFSTFPLQTTSPTQLFSCKSAPNFRFAAAAQTEEKFPSSPTAKSTRLPLILPGRRSVSSSSALLCVLSSSLSLLDADALLAEKKPVFDRLYLLVPGPLQKKSDEWKLVSRTALLTKICAPLVAFNWTLILLHNWAGSKDDDDGQKFAVFLVFQSKKRRLPTRVAVTILAGCFLGSPS